MLKIFLLFAVSMGIVLTQQGQLNWNSVAYGVSYNSTSDANPDGNYQKCILLGFGTHGAELELVQTWLENLYAKRLKELGISHLYAIQGPENPDFDLKEQANVELISDMVKLYSKNDRPYIIVVAHGEGAYVAHAMFEKMRQMEYLSVHLYHKIVYFMLDGTAGGYHPDFETKLLKTFGVYSSIKAEEKKKYSRYYSSVSAICYKYPEGCELIEIDGSDSGCETNYCLQDVLINKKPGRPDSNDITFDYSKFGRDRRVTHQYLDVLEREKL